MPLREKYSDNSDYRQTDNPVCPHCDYVCQVNDCEWWDLYDTSESDHSHECPSCGKEFSIQVNVTYTFSTDEQDEDSFS